MNLEKIYIKIDSNEFKNLLEEAFKEELTGLDVSNEEKEFMFSCAWYTHYKNRFKAIENIIILYSSYIMLLTMKKNVI